MSLRREYEDMRYRETTDDGQYRGMAKIPAARRWLRRRLEQAEKRGDTRIARQCRDRMRSMGMKP